MKRLALAALLALSYAAYAQETRTVTLYADKIYCGACAAVITKALRNVAGVTRVSVDVERKEVTVQFDPGKASVDELSAATAKKGFPATVRVSR